MKLQCSCGAKYAFDATPEMLQNPVKFVCPACGLDASAFVNELIRQEFGGQYTPPPPPPAAPAPVARLHISHEAPPAAPAAAAPAPAVSKFCAKHRERATEQCAVCHKPICPKCLELFGYFCSPLCKGKAEAEQMDVPVYAGRKDLVEAQFWQKSGRIFGAILALIVLFIGLWTWYAWFGSVPHKYFAARFADDDRAYHGSTKLVGKDQLVFLHGGTLARYSLKTGKPVWSQELISKQDIEAAVKAEMDEEARMAGEHAGGYFHRSSESDIRRGVVQGLQSELALHVSGQNIWVQKENKLTHYNWNSGSVERSVALPENEGELVEAGDELQIIGAQTVAHVSLASGEARVEKFGPNGAVPVVLAQNDAGGDLNSAGSGPLDPQKVEAQAQNMKLQGRVALPALLANAQHEKQLEAALNDDIKNPGAKKKNPLAPPADAELFQLVPGEGGFAEFSERLLEERIVERSAMKGPPKGKSILDSGNVNAMNEMDAVNEQLNEMQRNSGGDKVQEDQSRYQVTVRLPDAGAASDFKAEVVGQPQLFVLKTVNVIAAGKGLIVLDKSNKKLWEATLTYPVSRGGGFFRGEKSNFGDGPCVERGDTLYVFDQAVLTDFELASGNARWRLPSVGVVGLFFDDAGSLYVNTTTGNPDDIKYSRQIDITRKTEAIVLKVDAKTGKTLWSVKPGGYVSYLSGKFIYVVESFDPNPTDHEMDNDMAASLMKPAYLRIARINPKNGRAMFEYYDRDRSPFYVHFNANTIELVFKREVQVLRFLAL
jgi:hypothetical protein